MLKSISFHFNRWYVGHGIGPKREGYCVVHLHIGWATYILLWVREEKSPSQSHTSLNIHRVMTYIVGGFCFVLFLVTNCLATHKHGLSQKLLHNLDSSEGIIAMFLIAYSCHHENYLRCCCRKMLNIHNVCRILQCYPIVMNFSICLQFLQIIIHPLWHIFLAPNMDFIDFMSEIHFA